MAILKEFDCREVLVDSRQEIHTCLRKLDLHLFGLGFKILLCKIFGFYIFFIFVINSLISFIFV